ncbi:MAG: ArnT family glycosyltransferase, partial [Desulfobacteraceae bacterium]
MPAKLLNSTPSINDHDAPGYLGPALIVLIFALGILLRIIACQNTYIINPDGIYYIQQAKAIYYGQWQHLTSCLSFISIYSFLISITYPLFHDWIIAGKFVSLFFGSITLIPFYYLCRHFFKRDVSGLIFLIFAVLPVLVSWSAGVLRDPVAWFFLTLGLYFFIAWDHKHERLSALLACISFILATWGRIEGSLFIIVTFIYLLAISRREGFKRLTFFSLPIFIFLCLVFLGSALLDKP